jgi:hypothetical protein
VSSTKIPLRLRLPLLSYCRREPAWAALVLATSVATMTATAIRAFCDTPPTGQVDPAWQQNTTVYFDILPGVPQQSCIEAAIDEWNTKNAGEGGSGVQFLPAPGGTSANLVIGTNPNLQYPTVASTGTPHYDPETGHLDGHSFFFTDDTNILESCAGYYKATLHELGHTQGLGHTGGSGGSSVMNIFSGKDDAGGNLPESVTNCDRDKASTESSFIDADEDGWGVVTDCDDTNPEATFECCWEQVWNNEVEWCENGESTWWDYDICTCVTSPVIVDVSGNGFSLTNRASGVRFDLDQDGESEQLPWTSARSDDAWLVLDRNNNGIVDDGSELFGNFSPQLPTPKPNGFEALKMFDISGDNWIDRADPVYDRLLLWADQRRNGVSDPGELTPVARSWIKRISLDYEESSRRDQFGNYFRYKVRLIGDAERDSARWAFDVFFPVAMPKRLDRLGR